MSHGNKAAERRKLLEQTEARLGVRFPAAYREAVLAGQRWSRIEDWTLLALGDTHLCKHSEWQALRRRKGVVIGHDIGGNALILLFAPGSSTELAEPVYVWDHDSRDLERVGASFAEVLFPHLLDQAGSALLAFSEPEKEGPDDVTFWGHPERGGMCRACGSGMKGRPTCPVCGADRAAPPTADLEMLAAEKLVRALVQTGRLELVAPRTEAGVAAQTAFVLAKGGDARPLAESLVECWVDRPDVAEVYATVDEVEEALLTAWRGSQATDVSCFPERS